MKKNIFILFLLLFISDIAAFAIGKIHEEKLNYTALCIDQKNTLWIGTPVGLFQWKNSSSIRVGTLFNLHITALESIGNYLLIGTQNGKLFSFHKLSKTLTELGNMGAEISEITIKNKLLAIASKGNGYLLITPFSINHFSTANGLNDDYIYQLYIENENSIWSSSDKALSINKIESGIQPFSLNYKIPDRLVTCFAVRDSLVICGTQRGELCMLNLIDSTITYPNNQAWNCQQINAIKLLDQSFIVATNHGAFLYNIKGELLENITTKSVSELALDNEAMAWIGGDQVLLSTMGEQLSIYRNINNQAILEVHCITLDKHNQLYFTPDQGLMKYNLINEKTLHKALTPIDDLIDITSLYIDQRGTLWAGTMHRGLYKIDTATLACSRITIDTTSESNGILSITGDSTNIYVASLNGVWQSNINDKEHSFSSLEDKHHAKKNYVYQLKKDAKNNLWLATDGQGILSVQNGKLQRISKANNIHDKIYYSIEEDGMHQKWFNAINNGLYCLHNDSVIHLTINNGLSSNEVNSIIRYKDSFLIATNNDGIDVIQIQNFSVSHISFQALRLVIDPEINSITVDEIGNVYIGTNLGIVKFYIPSYKTQFAPPTFIDEILVMEKSNLKQRNSFSVDENYFRFKISAHQNMDQPIYYRYKLRGLSEQWNNTIDKEIVFPRLNPGQYEFIIQSSTNRFYHTPTQDQYAFTIQNPFWKQWWFVLLALGGAGIGFYNYIKFRDKRISRVQRLEKEKAIAEFETLKHQINPHFLFNSFNTLIQVIDEDPEKAIEYTQMLSDFYRSLISYREVDLVTLDEEMILLDKYMYLQKMRFDNNLILKNKCSQFQKDDILIPPLTLQLLAENAVKHNEISSNKPLTITIQMNANNISISNNINKKIAKEAGENIGLQNIKNRFKLYSSQEIEISIHENRFEVKLPILKTIKN